MAQSILVDPSCIPSSEAAHTALLLAHVAWNREIRGAEPFPYEKMLEVFEKSKPDLWKEIRSADCECIIDEFRLYKQQHYPEDMRTVLVCGMRKGNVHIEWF